MANLRANNLCGTGGRNAIDGSVFFDGSSKLSVPNSADVRLGSNDFTIEAWVKFGNVSGYWDAIMGMWDSSNTRRTFNLQRYKDVGGDNDAKLYLYVSSDGGSTNWAYIGGGNLTANEWHHVAGVRDGNTLRVYQNGVEVGNTSYSGTIYNNTTDALFIGDVESADTNNLNGYISNVRLVNGTCLYPSGTTFTPPTNELTLVTNTTVLACQDSDDPTQEATGKTITAAGNLADTAYVRQQPKVIPPYGVDSGVTFKGDTKINSQGVMYFPTGTTEERSRGRAVLMGGSIHPVSPSYTANIDYVEMRSSGVAVRFGSLAAGNSHLGAFSSTTRGIAFGGQTASPDTQTNVIQFVTIATEGNAIDFGDLLTAKRRLGGQGHANTTRGITAGGGGDSPAPDNVIEYVTMATTGNSINFGDLNEEKDNSASTGSSTRMLIAGGRDYTPSATIVNKIEYITMATTGNVTDFGDLTAGRAELGKASSGVRGLFVGGGTPTKVNTVDYITIATTGDAVDFGDIPLTTSGMASADNSIIGIFQGGNTPSRTSLMQSINIATTGDGSNYGDCNITSPLQGRAGCSDSHGGLS